MKKKEGWCFEKLVIFALAVVLLVSFVTIAAYTAGEKKAGMTVSPVGEGVRSSGPGATKAVVWDNGMGYDNGWHAQDDPVAGIDALPADDFMFATDQLVNDVHWLGGYWNGPPNDGDFDWRVTFYSDIGDAMPGVVINTWLFSNAQVNETFVEEYLPGVFVYSYSVDLPAALSFLAGTRYWISIQGVGADPPWSFWAMHSDPVQLHEAVFKSVYHGYPNWTNSSIVIGVPYDMCFQLTYEEPWPNHKMHFPQLPDLIGWDVNATFPKILADDWQCSRTGPVEDIHFWGSWKNIDGMPNTDDVYTPMPFFQLSIHSNLPVGHPQNPFEYSIPGELLWFWEGEIGGVPFDPPTFESWYDPNYDSTVCNDHMAYWRYDFFFDNAYPVPAPFYQYEDSIYWLDVSAMLIPPPYQWGWKTSRDHFMDDAVYRDPGGPWIEMYEPPRCNWFDVYFDATGTPEDWESSNYYGEGWYEYEYWWNMWFYNNPFTYDRPKDILIDRLYVTAYGPLAYAEFALNWSTPEWDALEMGRPPLPSDGNEELYIGRQIFGPLPLETLLTYNYTIPYNPEWVSIDFVAYDVVINGWVYHECVPTSMDLAFVITGPECTPSIDVEKKVWDEANNDWVDSIDMDVCNNAEFLMTIHNDGTCCDLTDIIVTDFMDASLEFVDANPPPDYVDPIPEGTLIGWSFAGPLEPCNTIDITVTAHVVGPGCHLDSNHVSVEGFCESTGEYVTDEDVAYVHATEPPWPDHKMHFPQLPNLEGWDIVATRGYVSHPGIVVADDFECTKTGPITDVHIWGSWLYDVEAPIHGFWLSIHDNIPGPPYSMPGAQLWSAYITDFEVTLEGQSPQGWYDPFLPWWQHPNHQRCYRYDIDSIPEPFYQDSGTIYWLDVTADLGPPGYQGFPEPPLWGWKTSVNHFEDDGVWGFYGDPGFWEPLYDPISGITLDMAFVITGGVLCGDVNHSGAVEAGDIVYLITYLFRSGPAPQPMCQGDVNLDDTVTAGDIVFLISYLFRSGPAPSPYCCP